MGSKRVKEQNEYKSLATIALIIERGAPCTAYRFAQYMGYTVKSRRCRYTTAQLGMGRLNYLTRIGYLAKMPNGKFHDLKFQGIKGAPESQLYSFMFTELGAHRLFFYETDEYHGNKTNIFGTRSHIPHHSALADWEDQVLHA